MSAKPYNLTCPQLGNYDIPIGFLVRKGLGLAYTSPPPMTKQTIELGAKHSPDYVCAPFKCMMGCYIEALEKGANVIIQTGIIPYSQFSFIVLTSQLFTVTLS